MDDSLELLYRDCVAKGLLLEDEAQLRVLSILECFFLKWQSFPSHSGPFWRSKASFPQGIYLWGDVGRGKSFLMDLLLQALTKKAVPVKKCPTSVWVQELQREAMPADQRASWAQQFVRQWPVLFLDEMEIVHIADAMVLQQALLSLWDAGVMVLITSNVPPSGLYLKGLHRDLLTPLLGRMERELQVVPLAGAQDYRRLAVASQDRYSIWPQTSEDPQVRRWWDDLTGHLIAQSHRLSFAGRTLELKRTAPQVCWMTFEEACGAPLGLLDYQALVTSFPFLVLSHIPRLTARDADAIRRFMLLVDLLYDRRHATFLSAAAPPEQLVEVEALKQMFQRTASRLQHMGFWECS